MDTQASPVLDPAVVANAPPRFHLLAKPSGSTCNIDCRYCFFLSKEALYPDERHRMSDATLEAYIRQLLESHRLPEVTVAWQGGEPTLMGLDFFRKAVELVDRHRRPGQRVEHTFQTNGVALDDEWCAFLAANHFLVGLSVDGPRELHDAYRVTRGGQGTFDLVMKGLGHLRAHRVEFNILCTVNAANQAHGRRVYQFFRDELGATWIQFIPIVERATTETLDIANRGWSADPRGKRLLYTQTGTLVTNRSVGARQYGQFLIDVFEEWVRRDVGHVFVQMFDVALANWVGAPPSLCVHTQTCGAALALEHTGDVYACDHYVEPSHLLGNIGEQTLAEMVASPQQRQFGRDKHDTLPEYCRGCDVRFACHGGCPKDRFVSTPSGEPGLNYLCPGYKAFFAHIDEPMRAMADALRGGRAPAEIMERYAAADRRRGRNEPCPCGSARKWKQCHGDRVLAAVVQ